MPFDFSPPCFSIHGEYPKINSIMGKEPPNNTGSTDDTADEAPLGQPSYDETVPLTDGTPFDSDSPTLTANDHGETEAAALFPDVEGYEITGHLGEGGMGTVYRAIQLGNRREVALKLMSARTLESDKAKRRFEREVELASSLNHPHIAQVFDTGLHKGVYYYAMALVDGISLNRFVRHQKSSPKEIIQIMRTICDTVEFAHQRGVIHRDLKPSNIMVDAEGNPTVLDFGLAKSLEQDQTWMDVSQEGDVAGTPAYMSPEQAAGRVDDIDTRSDVYALGVILYRLLTGSPPQDLSGSPYDVLRRIVEEEPKPPRSVTPNLDRDLDAILLKCLSKDPADRYGSAGALAEDLERFQQGEPITARPTTIGYFLRKRVKKHRTGIALTLIVLAFLVGVAVLAFVRISSERDDAVLARNESDRQTGIAQELEQDSRKQLSRQLVQRAWTENETAGASNALVFAVHAMKVGSDGSNGNEADERNQKIHRRRVGALLQSVAMPTVDFAVSSPVKKMWFGEDEAYLRVSLANGDLEDWSPTEGRLIKRYPKPDGEVLRHLEDGTAVVGVDDPVESKPLIDRFDRNTDTEMNPKYRIIQIWDVVNNLAVTQPLSHDRPVTDVRFTKDGELVVTRQGVFGDVKETKNTGEHGDFHTTRLSVISVWETATSKRLTTMKGNFRSFEVRDDEKLFGNTTGWARLWDLRSGRSLHNFIIKSGTGSTRMANASAISSDGKYVVSSTGSELHLFNAVTGEGIDDYETAPAGARGSVLSYIEFMPGLPWVYAWGMEGPGHWLYATDTKFVRGTLPVRHGHSIKSMKYMGNSRFITQGQEIGPWGGIAASKNRLDLRVWSFKAQESIALPHSQPVKNYEIMTRTGRVLTVSDGGFVRVWDTRRGRLEAGPWAHISDIDAIAYNPEGTQVASACEQRVLVWPKIDVAPGFRLGTGKLRNGSLSPDLTKLAYSNGKSLHIHDMTTDSLFVNLGSFEGFGTSALRLLEFSPEGNSVVATTAIGGSTFVSDALTGKVRFTPKREEGGIRGCEFSATGERFLTYRSDGVVIRDVLMSKTIPPKLAETKTTTKQVRGRSESGGLIIRNVTETNDPSGLVTFATFNSDGSKVATVSQHAGASVWDIDTGKVVTGPFQVPDSIDSRRHIHAQFSPDDQSLAVGRGDHIIVFDIATGQPMFNPLVHHNVREIRFSSDGLRIASRSGGRDVKLWDARSGDAIPSTIEHADIINSLRFSNNGKMILTASTNGTARVWNAKTGLPITPYLEHGPGLNKAGFYDDDNLVVTIGGGSMRKWPIAPVNADLKDLMRIAEALSGKHFGLTGEAENLSTNERTTAWNETRALRYKLRSDLDAE